MHSVRHVGAGAIKAGSDVFHLQLSNTESNRLYMAPNGTGDGLSADRPLGGFGAVIAALRNYAPLVGRWTVVGAAGTYNEMVTLPNWLANGANYLSFEFPSTEGSRVEPSEYAAFLDGAGLTATNGFTTGQGNRIHISNLCMCNWKDVALPNT